MFGNIYTKKRVLVTGHTGFKGSWLCTWLELLGAQVAGVALSPPSTPSHFELLGLKNEISHFHQDVRELNALSAIFSDFKPEIVFHLAAQPIVRASYSDPITTFETNIIGTINILEAVRRTDSVKAAVIITSDKCYKNLEWHYGYRETDILGGADPYSASKGCAEIVAQSYAKAFFQSEGKYAATTRAGNVIGGGDWAADRIIPDCVRAWSRGDTVEIRQPSATRPWQHVLEPLSGYLELGRRLMLKEPLNGEAFNFGPAPETNQSVGELVTELAQFWPNSKINIHESEVGKESTLLKLNCDKARHLLSWHAILDFRDTIRLVSDWYGHYRDSGDIGVRELTTRQIAYYVEQAKQHQLLWAQN